MESGRAGSPLESRPLAERRFQLRRKSRAGLDEDEIDGQDDAVAVLENIGRMRIEGSELDEALEVFQRKRQSQPRPDGSIGDGESVAARVGGLDKL